MHNSPIDLSDYEDITVEADIQSLKDFLDEHDSWEIPTKYKVEEYFPPEENPYDYSSTTYEITNLRITDIEDNVVLCDGYLDKEDIMLFDNMIENDIHYALNMFFIDDIIMISIINKIITISLQDGYIQMSY